MSVCEYEEEIRDRTPVQVLQKLLYAIFERCLRSCVVGLEQEHNSMKFVVVADKLENCIHVLLVLFHALIISDARCVEESDFVVDIFVLSCDDIRVEHLCAGASRFACVEILTLVRSIPNNLTNLALLPNGHPSGCPAMVHCEAWLATRASVHLRELRPGCRKPHN